MCNFKIVKMHTYLKYKYYSLLSIYSSIYFVNIFVNIFDWNLFIYIKKYIKKFWYLLLYYMHIKIILANNKLSASTYILD